MKLFPCDNCHQTLYFENSRCVHCGVSVAYSLQESRLVQLFEPSLLCRNGRDHDACNWMVTVNHDADLCVSCRLSEVIPDLSDLANDRAWRRIEAAKRRLLYTLFALQLPVVSRKERPDNGLSFHFLKGTADEPVMTGHENGVITLNIDEADFAFRENMREKMGEGYRTVLGHLRHEIGHYYWDVMVRDAAPLRNFRALFGDESASYEDAVTRHYNEGPPANWNESFISAYATMHPWEDWAETWAHYLHMVDTLETAKSHGLSLRAPAAELGGEKIVLDDIAFFDFESLTSGWNVVTLAMNSLNRSMGMEDAYPFVLSPTVLGKLRYVHELVQWERRATKSRAAA
ncbi:MAG: putative zinc-binding metallopeptidase [Steroidobacteraceae bacterium]|nr:putative zinc-binding metallopeptidase [Steroidobacteraceae bacterium]